MIIIIMIIKWYIHKPESDRKNETHTVPCDSVIQKDHLI